jgi:hypothetical protein
MDKNPKKTRHNKKNAELKMEVASLRKQLETLYTELQLSRLQVLMEKARAKASEQAKVLEESYAEARWKAREKAEEARQKLARAEAEYSRAEDTLRKEDDESDDAYMSKHSEVTETWGNEIREIRARMSDLLGVLG